jgi:DNA modification methylase
MSVRLLLGDCREVLKTLPDCSVHTCITSPPYWGLRAYLPAEHPDKHMEIGSEPTVEAWVQTMVEVFREVRRVLRDDGTCWINLGDSYAGSRCGGQSGASTLRNPGQKNSAEAKALQRIAGAATGVGIKPKDMIGQPWRVAFALQQPYYTGQIKSERDREWLAAMIDGEGCFFIHKRKAGTPSYSKFTRADGSEANYTRKADTFGVGLEICNTSKAIIDRVQAIVGVGTFTEQTPQQNGRRKQTIYRWRVAPNEAKRIAQEVYPHLVAKQHQARLLFACPSTGEAGAAAHQAMMDLHAGITPAVDYPPPPTLFEPGWYLRQELIWGKKNPMPESCRDRFTKAHEHVFLLSKRERYYFDFDAVQEEVEGGAHARRPGNKAHRAADLYAAGDEKHRTKAGLVAYAERQRAKYKTPDGWDTRTGEGGHGSFHAEGREKGTIKPPHDSAASRKARANAAAKAAPTELHNGMRGQGVGHRQGPPGNLAPTPKAALATSGNDGAYADGANERMGRGAGWRNKNNESFDEAMAVMPDTRNPRSIRWLASEPFKGAHFATYPPELIRPFVIAGCPPSGTVLDPFGGSGTTGLVADQEGRSAILIDLDERNLPMATDRIRGDNSLFADIEVA